MRQFLRTIALYAFHILFVRPIIFGLVGARYRRRGPLPEGPCLVVSNHNSHLDAAVLLSMFPLRRLRRVHPVAAADYFGKSWFMSTMAMLLMNGIPIERRPTRGSDPLAPIAERLQDGESLIFFPEGSRGEAGVVAPFRPGVGRLLQAAPGLLVVPVFMSGPERIWPRGNVVPIPLAIDANVGRARTYDAAPGPKEIADAVRRDVLALAPPPPPPPGERPSPPKRFAIVGIDRARRAELMHEIAARLGRSGHTLGLAEGAIEADADGVREVNAPIAVGLSQRALSLLVALVGAGRRVGRRRLLSLVERAQIDEAIGLGRGAQFVCVDGSAFVELLAWTEAQLELEDGELHRVLRYVEERRWMNLRAWWRAARSMPELWLVHTFNLVRPPMPDVLVVASAEPGAAARKMRERGEPLSHLDTEEGLARLQGAYRRVSDLLRRRRQVVVVPVDPAMPASEAAAMVDELRPVADSSDRPS